VSFSDGFELLVRGAPTALIGATAFLGVGFLAALRCGPALRQRVCEVAVGCAVIWSVVAWVPLPRMSPNDFVASYWVESEPSSGAPSSGAPSSGAPGIDASKPGGTVIREPAGGPVHGSSLEGGRVASPTSAISPIPVATTSRPTDVAPALAEDRTGLKPDSANLSPVAARRSVDASPVIALPIAPEPKGRAAWVSWSNGSLARGLVAAWIVGALLVATWLLIGLLRVLMIVRAATKVDVSDDLPSGFRGRVLASRDPVRPFCFGAIRPVIVVPQSILTGDPSVRRSVLHHEATHAARRDGVGQWVFAMAWPLFFFHPLLWVLRHRARFAAEILADDGAALGRARRTYARDLLRLAEASLKPAPASSIAAAMTRNPSELTRRIEMLMQPSAKPLATRCSRGSRWLIAGAAAFALIPSALVFGAKPSPAPAPTSGANAQEGGTAQDEEIKAELIALRNERDDLKSALVALEKRLAKLTMAKDSNPVEPGDRTGSDTHAKGGKATRFGFVTDGIYVSSSGGISEVEVKKGDTLVGILRDVLGRVPKEADMDLIRKLNPELDAHRLSVGQKLRVLMPSRQKSEGVENPPSGLLSALASEPKTKQPYQPATRPLGSIDPTVLEALVQRIEVSAELEIAKENLARLHKMVENGITSSGEASAAEARYRVARSKAELFDALIEMEVVNTASKINAQERVLEYSEKLHESGFVGRAELEADRVELERLRRQLDILSRDF